MGEMADDIIDGSCCQQCMEYFDTEAPGFPRFCHACARELRAEGHQMQKLPLGGYTEALTPSEKHQGSGAVFKAIRRKVACPQCGKRVWESGLSNHTKDVHASPSQPTDKLPADARHILAKHREELMLKADAQPTDCHSDASAGHPEDKCERCGRDNVVWFTPNRHWNTVARRTDGTDPMLCPTCFIAQAQSEDYYTGAWRVEPDDTGTHSDASAGEGKPT